MTSYPIFLVSIIEAGEQNHVSKRTYCAGICADFAPFSIVCTTSGAFVCASFRCLPPLLLASTLSEASCSLFSRLAEERRQWSRGMNVFPSLQPSVSMRKPLVNLCVTWSYTFAKSSTCLERALLKRESSTIRTFRRSVPVRGSVFWIMPAPSCNVNLRQLILLEFMRR